MKEDKTLDDYCIRQAQAWRAANPERGDLCVGWSLSVNGPVLEVLGRFGFAGYQTETAHFTIAGEPDNG